MSKFFKENQSFYDLDCDEYKGERRQNRKISNKLNLKINGTNSYFKVVICFLFTR